MSRAFWAFLWLSAFTIVSANGAEQPGLLGRWELDEAQGDVAVDSSSHGNDGDIWGARWVQGDFGTALAFDGSGARVQVPQIAGLDGANEMSVEAWVYWEGTGRYPNIISGGTWSPGGFLIFVQDGNCSFRMGRPDASSAGGRNEWRETSAPFLAPFRQGRWYHLAATFKLPEIRTYVDGAHVGSADWDYPVGYKGDLVIGQWSGPVGHKGLIDGVRLYNRALSADQVAASFQETAPHRQSPPGSDPAYQEVPAASQLASAVATFETNHASLAVGPTGRCIALLDRSTGENRLLRTAPLVTIADGGARDGRAVCSLENDKLLFRFPRSGAAVALEVTPGAGGDYLVFRLDSVEGASPDEVSFVHLDLKPCPHVQQMSGLAGDDRFGVCLRALNLETRVNVGGNPPVLAASATTELGLQG
ncbi:MAG: LamG domain-containing protein, partial [Thermoguttaceae bacterium]